MDPTLSALTLLVLLLTFALVTLGAGVLRRRGTRLAVRFIPAYSQMPRAVAEAVEDEHPVHISFGGSGIGAGSTVSALAVSEVLYPLAELAAVTDQAPIVTLSDPTTLPLAQSTLARAYALRRNLDAYQATAARWYPQGPRSLAFAAGVAAALANEEASVSVVGGSFGAEIGFIGALAARRNQPFFGQSDQLDGQAVAWAMSEQPLIGEELYVAPVYLSRQPTAAQQSQLLTLDLLRLLAVLLILVVAFASVARLSNNTAAVLTGTGGILLVVAVPLTLYFVARGLRRRRERAREAGRGN